MCVAVFYSFKTHSHLHCIGAYSYVLMHVRSDLRVLMYVADIEIRVW